MKKLILLCFALSLSISIVIAQSGTIHLCNNCTYKNAADGQTITFNKNGTVKLNGKAAPGFMCFNNDGTVELYYKGKLKNKLVFSVNNDAQTCTLMDNRKICYALISCKGSK